MWDSVVNRDVGWWTVPVGSSLSLQHPVFQLRDVTLASWPEEQGWESEEEEPCYGWASEEKQEACTEDQESCPGSARLQIRDVTLVPCIEGQEGKSLEVQESSGDKQVYNCEDRMSVMQREGINSVLLDELENFSVVGNNSQELELSREIKETTESSGSKVVISTNERCFGASQKDATPTKLIFPEAAGAVTAVSKKVRIFCKSKCAGCLLPPCGSCRFCKDSAKFKGPNKLRKRCQLRKCQVGGVKRKGQRQTSHLQWVQDPVPLDHNGSTEAISGEKFEIKKCYVAIGNSETVQEAIEDQVKIVSNLRMKGIQIRNIGSGDICDICGKKTKSTGGVYSHKKIFHYMEGFMCDICGRRNMQQGNYKAHMKKHHPYGLE